MSLIHGGNLIRASAEYGIPLTEWIDLSTGISPWSWPVPAVPQTVWQRLPEDDDGLLESAASYYNCPPETLLAVPGSQYAISRLPALFPPASVALPHWGYREHQHAWEQAGHRAVYYQNELQLCTWVEDGTVTNALVINPNNPSAALLQPALLAELASTLERRGGSLVVDEAFMDPHPDYSLLPLRAANTVVLRSLGKFFGLAGIRLGFAVASPALLARLAVDLDPWAVNHPARWLGRKALLDRHWQTGQRDRLEACSRTWCAELRGLFPGLDWHRTALFISTETDQAPALFNAAARRGLLLRLHADRTPSLLRIGLPADPHWTRALTILDDIRREL
ncbi:MAG: threonine-phosphate decarboxylase CobD [Porticoccaceae bacterium]|nr:threonine-phosphate decarboxylase CobD [Porticoccaceae bacterium]